MRISDWSSDVCSSDLTVITDTDVLRLTHEGRRIAGVRIRNAEGERDIAAREVILSAGALNSPLLLQRSGIGPADHLKGVGVEVLHDAPGVARNMREHRLLRAQYQIGSTSCRDRVGQYVSLSVAAASLKKKKKK